MTDKIVPYCQVCGGVLKAKIIYEPFNMQQVVGRVNVVGRYAYCQQCGIHYEPVGIIKTLFGETDD